MQQAASIYQQWDEAAIQAHITGHVRESVNLDYKEHRELSTTDQTKRTSISKDVSSFANSEGGTIIYGIAEDADKLLPAGMKGYDPAVITKEWLENIVTSTVHPRIPGVRITPVPIPHTEPGKVIYVVEVPQSTTAHMAADNRYYKRHNFKAEPMEDFEVRDVFRRSEIPDLTCMFSLASETGLRIEFEQSTPIVSKPFDLTVQIANRASEPAFYAFVQVYVDTDLHLLNVPADTTSSPATILVGGLPIPATKISMNWGIPGKMPIWQGVNYPFGDSGLIKFGIKREFADSPGRNYYLHYFISAPKMGNREGSYVVTQSNGRLYFTELPVMPSSNP